MFCRTAGWTEPGPQMWAVLMNRKETPADCLTDESLLGQLDGEPPGDFLQLSVLKTETRCNTEEGFYSERFWSGWARPVTQKYSFNM